VLFAMYTCMHSQAKWVSYKLSRHARDHFDRQQPVEKRVIEYLCSIPDPAERRTQMDNAFTPGPSRCVCVCACGHGSMHSCSWVGRGVGMGVDRGISAGVGGSGCTRVDVLV